MRFRSGDVCLGRERERENESSLTVSSEEFRRFLRYLHIYCFFNTSYFITMRYYLKFFYFASVSGNWFRRHYATRHWTRTDSSRFSLALIYFIFICSRIPLQFFSSNFYFRGYVYLNFTSVRSDTAGFRRANFH